MPSGNLARMYVSDSDIAWLNEQMERYKIPQRRLAEALEMDPSTLNRALAGNRKVKRVEFSKALAFIESVIPRHPNRLIEAVWEARLSSAEIAGRTGLQPERVFNILSGVGEAPSDRELDLIARRIGVSLEQLFADDDSVSVQALVRRGRPDLFKDDTRRDTEVTGTTLMDIYAAPRPLGGPIFSARGELVERRTRPVPLDTRSSYGLFVSENMLHPRYLAGEILWVHPGKPFVAGRWVVVDLENGNLAIGELRASNAEFIELMAAGATEPTRLSRAEVLAISPIAGTWSY